MFRLAELIIVFCQCAWESIFGNPAEEEHTSLKGQILTDYEIQRMGLTEAHFTDLGYHAVSCCDCDDLMETMSGHQEDGKRIFYCDACKSEVRVGKYHSRIWGARLNDKIQKDSSK